MKRISALILLAATVAHAQVSLDTANAVSGNAPSGTSLTLSVTLSASDNFLVVGEEDWTSADVTGITYNGVALTEKCSGNNGSSLYSGIWYLASPPTGSAYNLVISFASTSGIGATAVGASGVNTGSPFGTCASNGGISSVNPSVTATGAGSNGVYIGIGATGDTTLTIAGANQTLVGTAQNNVNTIMAFQMSSIPGVDTGAFSWTGSGTGGGTEAMAAAVALLPSGGSSNPPPPLFVIQP